MPQIRTKLSSKHGVIRNERTVKYFDSRDSSWFTVKEADALMEDRSVEVYFDGKQWVAKYI